MADVTHIASDLQFPEGPIALSDGSILLVEIKRGTLTWLEADGAVRQRFDLGGGPNGAAFGPDGKVYVCNNGGCFDWQDVMGLTFPGPVPAGVDAAGSIQRVDLDSGEVETVYTESVTPDGDRCRCGRRTTSSSTPTAASGSPTTASVTDGARTSPASTTPPSTVVVSSRRSIRSTPPTASACRPTGPSSTWPRPTPAGCGAGRSPGPGEIDASRPTRSARPAATCSPGCQG